MTLPDNGAGPDNLGIGIPDPQLQVHLQRVSLFTSWLTWSEYRELTLNGVSLAFGFTGNFFLLLHFRSRVRYIIALPVFVICWLLSAAIVRIFPSQYPPRNTTMILTPPAHRNNHRHVVLRGPHTASPDLVPRLLACHLRFRDILFRQHRVTHQHGGLSTRPLSATI